MPDVPLPARPKRRSDGLSFIILATALVGGAVGIGGARALTGSPVPASSPVTTPAAVSSTDQEAQAAIRDVLRQANAAQAAAFAKHDPTLMKATSTAAHYAEMTHVNADLASAGVTGIALVDMTVGEITVKGTTARAITTETWSSLHADGTTDRSIEQNDYVLVLENGSWLISSNTQPNAVPGGTGTTVPTGGVAAPAPAQ